MSDIKAKCTKFDFRWGGLPNTQAVRQPTSKGREELKGGKEEGRVEGNGKGRNKGGRDLPDQSQTLPNVCRNRHEW